MLLEIRGWSFVDSCEFVSYQYDVSAGTDKGRDVGLLDCRR